MVYYFAYGSNMSIKRIKARLPSVEKVGIFSLAQHKLAFHKKGDDGSAKADAYFTANSNDKIIGLVFRLTSSDIEILDKIEGVGAGYEQKQVTVFNEQNESLLALTYYATKIDSTLKPYPWYHHHVSIGATQASLPESYIESIESITTNQDPDAKRQQREMFIYNQAPIVIRQYETGEEKHLWKIFYHTVRRINLGDYTQTQVEAWAPDSYNQEYWCRRVQKISPFVATIDKYFVGYADTQVDGYIDHFFCHHAYQGIGVGKKLITKLFDTARQRQLEKLYTHASITARPFFEYFGFQLVKPQQVEIRGQTLTNFVLEKRF